jgi:GNAT superfamily N-acetyltransferase
MQMCETEIRRVGCMDILGAPNAEELFAQYAAECSVPLIGPISPKVETYKLLEEAGALHFLGAYADGELVGFASVLCIELPHYSRKAANVESLFIAKDHRAGGAGRLLMAAVERDARECGCEAIIYTAPLASVLEKLLNLTGVARTHSVFCRRLA